MIRLSKIAEPDILASNAAAWTEELLECLRRGETPSDELLGRYNHRDIKNALLCETSKKCAYCESFFRHVTYGDIEHIVPKKRAPNLRFAWNNLTIACDVCNTNKGTKDEIIDPYESDPADFFFYIGPIVLAKPNNEPGRLTESELKLNRPDLYERRLERIMYLRSLLETAIAKEGALREAIMREVRDEISADRAYSAMAIAFVEDYLAQLAE